MPTVSAPAKVLVTGASGFIAVWVVKTLLDQGYSVVGTGMTSSSCYELPAQAANGWRSTIEIQRGVPRKAL